jgi:teichuronic acid biosynthesis glycosyltransferase TuaH
VKDLVVISLEPWDEVWRRNQHLVAGLMSRDPGLRVLFVEPSADPIHAASRRARPRRGRGLRPGPPSEDGGAGDGLWLLQPTKWLPRRVDRRADVRWARRIVAAASHLGFSRPLLWVNDPSGAEVLDLTGWPAVYDITDDWILADRPPAEHERLVRLDTTLLQRCEEVVVCSPGLVTSKGRERDVTLVPNAVDVASYRLPRPRPDDLPEGPTAVYLGTVHRDRMDLALCIRTARELAATGARLVLVGPTPLDATDRAALEEAGIVLVGAVHRDLVPGYLQHADVLVVPHRVTPFTDSLDPIKLYEYRAVGRPVVATPVAGVRDRTDPRVVVADSETFPSEVAARLPSTSVFPDGTGDDVPRWQDRVHLMAGVLDRLRAQARLRA